MAWLSRLRPASFRGAQFKVDTVGLTVGRRIARHEYPQRDIPYLEDMGRKARAYKIEAMVLGQNYMAGRDALLRALEQEGSGQLVHPYYGTLQVVVDGECQITESTQHGGLAKIAIIFIEAGKQQEPKARVDTFTRLKAQFDACIASFVSDFVEKFDLLGAQDFVFQDALSSVQSFMDTVGISMGNLSSIRANPLSPLTGLLPENIQSSLSSPLSLANGVMDLVTKTSNPVALLGFSLPSVVSNFLTPSRLLQDSNRTAFTDLVQQGATALQVMNLASLLPATLNDARVARSQVVDLTDSILMKESTSQASADSMLQLRTDAVSHFATLIPSLPSVTQVKPQAVLPAIVMAHDMYGDNWLAAGRDVELIARNQITRPGFVPAGQDISLVT